MTTKAPPGHFRMLYFASASSFTGQTSDDLPAPLPLTDLFNVLENKYPGIHKQVLRSCAVTINLIYVDLDNFEARDSTQAYAQESLIQEGDEVAIIPPDKHFIDTLDDKKILAAHALKSLSEGLVVIRLLGYTLYPTQNYQLNPAEGSRRTQSPSDRRRDRSSRFAANMNIDPQLRDHSQGAAHTYGSLPPPPPSYALNPAIRLPLPQQHQSTAGPPWPQDGGGQQYYNSSEIGQNGVPQHPLANAPFTNYGGLGQADGSAGPNQTTSRQQHADDGNDPKRPRACEACRGLKVRCEPDPIKGACRRCAKANRTCVVTAPSRKRQKKTDNRVAELEKKINALEATLQTKGQTASVSDGEYEEALAQTGEFGDVSQNTGQPLAQYGASASSAWSQPLNAYSSSVGENNQPTEYSTVAVAGQKRRFSDFQQELAQAGASVVHSGPSRPNYNFNNAGLIAGTALNPILPGTVVRLGNPALAHAPACHEYTDVIDRNIVDVTTATEMFYHFVTNMGPLIPVVVFPSSITAEEIREQKPMLFLTILSVASGTIHPVLQQSLVNEVMTTLAERIITRGQQSLDLIQALEVASIWIWSDGNFTVNHYQLAHMAATMAIDLGLDKRVDCKSARPDDKLQDHAGTDEKPATNDPSEYRRAWLGCFFLCANASMGLIRRELISWDDYLDECIQDFGVSADAVPSDHALGQWVRLQRVAQSMNRSNPGAQWDQDYTEACLSGWRKQFQDTIDSPSLSMQYDTIDLNKHEAAMNINPSLERSDTSVSISKRGKANSGQTSTISRYLASIRSFLDTFAALPASTLRSLPVFLFVRAAHASTRLIKMHRIAPSLLLKQQVQQYLLGLIDTLRTAADNGKYRVAYNFLLVTIMLNTWFEGKASSVSQQTHSQAPDNTSLHLLSVAAAGKPASINDPSFGSSNVSGHQPNGYPASSPGFSQAISMTLREGNLRSSMFEDDGFLSLVHGKTDMLGNAIG